MLRAPWCLGVIPLAAGLLCLDGGASPAGRVDPTASLVDCNANGIPDQQETVPKFTTVVIDSMADGAYALAAADVDGDGDTDLLAASEDGDTITWYENQGGTFGPRRVIDDDADGASDVVAADLDGDGDLDVAHTNKNWPLFMVWQENLDGLGHFGFARPVTSALEENKRAIDAADFDGDGDLDLTCSIFHGNKVRWFENAGGPVAFLSDNLIGIVLDPNTVVAADLDGDADPDIVTASQEAGSVEWWRNDGQGAFTQAEVVDAGLQIPRNVRVGDLDGDTDLDLIVTDWRGNKVVWYENQDGLGTFGPQRTVSNAIGGAETAIAVDLDNDGDLDVVVAAATGSTGPGPESTCCQPNSFLCSDEECWRNIVEDDGFCFEVTWDSICAQAAIADPDCSVGCGGGTGRVIWLENLNGTGTFGPPKLIASTEASLDIVAADLDGDGSADLVSASFIDDKILVHFNQIDDCNGNDVPDSCDIHSAVETDADCNGLPDSCEADGGTGPDCNANAVPDRCELQAGTSADCTGNGVPDECEADCNGNGVADSCDIAQGSPDANGNAAPDACDPDCNGNGVPDDLDIGLGLPDCDANGVPDACQADCDGNGTADACDTEVSFAMHTISGGNSFGLNVDLAPADLDGDGDLDLVSVGVVVDKVGWYRNLDSDGSFGAMEVIPSTPDSPDTVACADIDADGDVDLIVGAGDNNWLGWYENLDGQATFAERVIALDHGVGINIVAADMDGDGDIDLIAGASGSGLVLRRNLLGTGLSWSKETILPANSILQVSAADIDTDGDLDLVFGGIGEPSYVGWIENLDGQGHFGPPSALVPPDPVNSSVLSVSVADIDGDGDRDLVAGGVAVIAWYQNLDGAGTFAPPVSIAAEWKATTLLVRDFDGDGDGDVLYGSSGFGSTWPGHVGWIENLGGGEFGLERTISAGSVDLAEVTAADFDGDGDIDSAGSLLTGASDIIAWFENLNDDCDGNGAPDGCDADCDADGLNDVCALAAGITADCNANGVPDRCDTGCTAACDDDADGCEDPFDAAPLDPLACADTDGDGCNDCAGGSFAPGADGVDADQDGFCAVSDCADTSAGVWAAPSPARLLVLGKGPGPTQLAWQIPLSPGALAVRYDVLRSPSASSFFGGTLCLEADQADRVASDADLPPPGAVYHYLVRSENGCPGSDGNLGADSSGTPRTGLACP